MTKKFILLFVPVLFITLSTLINAQQNGALNSSTLERVTGAPGEFTCNYCHVDYANNSGTGSLSIQFNGGNNFYVPGNTYTITVTATGSTINKYGFQMTSLRSSDSKLSGRFIPVAGTDTFYIQVSSNPVTFRRYIEQ